MTRMAPLLRWRKRGNVSAPSPPTFYYRRGTFLNGGRRSPILRATKAGRGPERPIIVKTPTRFSPARAVNDGRAENSGDTLQPELAQG